MRFGIFNHTLLHDAAYYNSTACLKVLLRFAPHHLEAVNDLNTTPLMWAVGNDKREAAKMLLRTGADVRKKNSDGETVFDLVRIYGHEKMLEILNQHQQVSGIF